MRLRGQFDEGSNFSFLDAFLVPASRVRKQKHKVTSVCERHQKKAAVRIRNSRDLLRKYLPWQACTTTDFLSPSDAIKRCLDQFV
jgi:hypothetical protein